MNWEAVGAIGEIIGAVAVVVSILYLAAQISSNTRAIRSDAGFEATHSWATFNEIALSFTDEHLASLTRAYGGEGWESFTEIERARMSISMRALFQKLEGQYYLYKYGTLDRGLWDARSSWAAGVIQTQFFRRWWEIEKLQRMYSDEFVQALEEVTAISIDPEILGGSKNGASTLLETLST